MRNVTSLLLIAFLFPTLDCGSDNPLLPPSSFSPLPPATLTVAGNWEINAQAVDSSGHSLSSAGFWELFGTLDITGSQVEGLLHQLSSLCYLSTDAISISGTISSGNNSVSLTSSSLAGQTLTIAGLISPDRKRLVNATYAINGGCGNGEHGTMTGFLVPSFTNTYTGTFTSFPGGKATSVTVSLAQSPTPDPFIFFPVTSATATFANNTCFSSGELSSQGGLVFGNHVGVSLSTNDGGELSLSATVADPSDNSITGTYRVLSGTCSNEFGFVLLTHA